MLARSAAAPLLVGGALLLAGCLGSPQAAQPNLLPGLGGILAPAAEPLWVNPQTTPHPMFNFPTLSHPATGANIPAWWQPIPSTPLPSPITGMEHHAATSEQVPSGGGMAIFGSIAVVPGYGNPTSVVDIRDPAAPKLIGIVPEDNHRNVDFIAYPSGRLVAVFSTGDGILPIWDLTDPANPKRLGEMQPTSGTHKVNIVPGTPIVYNANSNGGGCLTPDPTGITCFLVPVGQPRTAEQGQGITEIFDLTDPEKPVHVQDWANGFGCHHIYFWNSVAENKFRALCAGIEMTQIWDTADPRNPQLITNVPMQHGDPALPSSSLGLFSFSHFSILNYAGTVLIAGDEMGGGGFPPGCAARAPTPARDVTTPFGALWFYDVRDEANPRLMGWFSPGHSAASNPPEAGVGGVFYSCTAHHGRLVPDPDGRDLLAMAFYRAGVVLVDFTDPSAPHMLDQWNEGANTWEVQYYNGYLFTGDLQRGMDVLKLA